MYVFFFRIQTLPRILCAGAISHVSFLDLFGPIAGAINPICNHFYSEYGMHQGFL